MADQTDANGAKGTGDHDKAENQEDTQDQSPTNADAKKLPWVREMAEELNALRQEKIARKEADDAKAREAAIKDAEAKGKFEEALALQKAEFESDRASFKAQLLQRDLTTELLDVGFSKRTAAFLTSEYDAEKHGDPTAYAKTCLEDEGNAQFLIQQSEDPTKPKPPPKVTKGKAGSTDWEQVKAWEKGDDREKRIEARALISAYNKEHGEYPYKLD